MTPTLSRAESRTLLSLSAACLAVIAQTLHTDGAPLTASIAFSILAFASTYALIRWLGEAFVAKGFKGKDVSKKHQPTLPETMGLICGLVYIFAIILFIPFAFSEYFVQATSGGGNKDRVVETQDVNTGRLLQRFPHHKLASYLSAVASLLVTILLGLLDDLFDIRWRHKVPIPAVASLTMLIVYRTDFGVTEVVIPTLLRPHLGPILDLGWVYYAYMSALCIFAPNSINILAGVNGLEVSQSIVIAMLILTNDLLYVYPPLFRSILPSILPFHHASHSTPYAQPFTHPATDSHLFSIYLLLPFLGVSLALWTQNWYPAKVFVGDTYCYFAGMVFAVVAILGHFSKTLLLLFVPQIFNFVYSAPQLFGLIPCPRHRLPHFNARTGLLEESWADFVAPVIESPASNGHASPSAPASGGLTKHRRVPLKRPLHPLVQQALKILHTLRLVRIETDPETGTVLRCTNLTLLNLWLVWFGPMREDRLAMGLSALQVVAGAAGLWVRHSLALWVFPVDNLPR